MKQRNLYLLAGCPGSGKSTWVKNWIENDDASIIVSRDEIRFSILKDGEDYFAHEDEVYRIFIQKIQTALECPLINNIFIDATHLNPKARRKVLNALTVPKEVKIGCVYFTTPLNICIERNNLREGRAKVPEQVIRNMHSSYVFPTCWKEGFDMIYEVDENGIVWEKNEGNE